MPYRLDGATHTHVHGANLGVRADAYQAVGGWGLHVMVGEDHELVRRLTAAGLTVTRDTDTTVVTSSRTVGRVPAGFATRLAQLAGPPVPATGWHDQLEDMSNQRRSSAA